MIRWSDSNEVATRGATKESMRSLIRGQFPSQPHRLLMIQWPNDYVGCWSVITMTVMIRESMPMTGGDHWYILISLPTGFTFLRWAFGNETNFHMIVLRNWTFRHLNYQIDNLAIFFYIFVEKQRDGYFLRSRLPLLSNERGSFNSLGDVSLTFPGGVETDIWTLE